MSEPVKSAEGAPRVPVPLGDRIKAGVAGLFGLAIFALAAAVFVFQVRKGSWMGLGAALLFFLFSVPFALLAFRLWTGADRQPVPEGYKRCEACRRALPLGQLGTMWGFAATLFTLQGGGVARAQADRRLCRRCALTESVGALFLVALAVTAIVLQLFFKR